MLLGPTPDRVDQVIEAPNVAQDRRRRFAIDPRVLLRVHRQARVEHRVVVGYYHSHPASPPQPSQTDLDDAWPGELHVIIGVEGDGAAAGRTSIAAWRRTDDAFESVPIRDRIK